MWETIKSAIGIEPDVYPAATIDPELIIFQETPVTMNLKQCLHDLGLHKDHISGLQDAVEQFKESYEDKADELYEVERILKDTAIELYESEENLKQRTAVVNMLNDDAGKQITEINKLQDAIRLKDTMSFMLNDEASIQRAEIDKLQKDLKTETAEANRRGVQISSLQFEASRTDRNLRTRTTEADAFKRRNITDANIIHNLRTTLAGHAGNIQALVEARQQLVDQAGNATLLASTQEHIVLLRQTINALKKYADATVAEKVEPEIIEIVKYIEREIIISDLKFRTANETINIVVDSHELLSRYVAGGRSIGRKSKGKSKGKSKNKFKKLIVSTKNSTPRYDTPAYYDMILNMMHNNAYYLTDKYTCRVMIVFRNRFNRPFTWENKEWYQKIAKDFNVYIYLCEYIHKLGCLKNDRDDTNFYITVLATINQCRVMTNTVINNLSTLLEHNCSFNLYIIDPAMDFIKKNQFRPSDYPTLQDPLTISFSDA